MVKFSYALLAISLASFLIATAEARGKGEKKGKRKGIYFKRCTYYVLYVLYISCN